jgi:hypothetical protein
MSMFLRIASSYLMLMPPFIKGNHMPGQVTVSIRWDGWNESADASCTKLGWCVCLIEKKAWRYQCSLGQKGAAESIEKFKDGVHKRKKEKRRFTGTNYQLSILWSLIHILSLSFSFFSFSTWNTPQSIASNYQKQITKHQRRHHKQNQKILSPISTFPYFSTFPLPVLEFLLDLIVSKSPFNLPSWLLYLVNAT